MGIFTRFRDIVGSNINSMLDRAEDPEKLIKLMIQEMEYTLIELKAACAGVMAENKKVIAVGSCAISGGPFRKSYNIGTTVDKIIPVNMYVPNCPPRPESIINGILKLLGESDE